jgi:peptidoglycan/xylan/chitin deacetylase (PgdA/CDA1 family)
MPAGTGLLEFKKKYPDYGVTATFFVNSSLFMQDKYNNKILNWLVNNGYDIGNHTMSHCDFRNIKSEKVKEEVGGLYQILEGIIPDNYVSIVALPFGSPYSRSHGNYENILNGNYLGFDYQTKAALRVGWEAETSCFNKDFDATYLKRIRAYDNNGKDYDIEMNFRLLKDKRYISDGDYNTIVVHERDIEFVGDKFEGLMVITY